MNRDLSSFFVFGQSVELRHPEQIRSPLTLAVLALGGPATRADWPEFRGPWGDGHVSARATPNPSAFRSIERDEQRQMENRDSPPRLVHPGGAGGQVWLTTAPDRCLLVYSRWPFKNAEGGACKAIILREIRVTRLPAVTH